MNDGMPVDFSIDPFFFSMDLNDRQFPCGGQDQCFIPILEPVSEPDSLSILGIALITFYFARYRQPRGYSRERAAFMVEGLRKAGLPEE